jgi:hypothetical protein
VIMSKEIEKRQPGGPISKVRKGGFMITGGTGGGVAGAGTGAAIGFALGGPPGAAIGFLAGLFGSAVGGAFAGKKADNALFEESLGGV